MYRPSNERYSEGGNIKNHGNFGFPPPGEHSMPKMHLDNYQSTLPPNYEYLQNNNSYDFMPTGNNSGPPPVPDNFDRSYPIPPPNWRDPSESSKPMSMGNINMANTSNQSMNNTNSGHFDMRGMQGHSEYQSSKNMGESFVHQSNNPPQINVVQRISGLIKSQLSMLQSILVYVEKKTIEERQKKERSRSRSRDKDEKKREHKEWICPKCKFLNFDFRDECKKCNESKPVDRNKSEKGSYPVPKNYVPNPEDWRCVKCSNINYARRTECHRCRTPKGR